MDVGVKDLLVVATSDGAEVARIAAPKPLTRAQSRLRAAHRRAARRCGPYDPDTKTRREPSKRWQRATARVGRIHATVAAIRAHVIHQATTELATRHEVVAGRTLSAKNMSRRGGRRKRGLNRALGDAALGRIRTQLGYKSPAPGSSVCVVTDAQPSHTGLDIATIDGKRARRRTSTRANRAWPLKTVHVSRPSPDASVFARPTQPPSVSRAMLASGAPLT